MFVMGHWGTVIVIASLLGAGKIGDGAEKRDGHVTSDWEKAAAWIVGAAEVEELSEEVMERFARLHERPLDINAAPRGRLMSCGLMNAFQVESILEYRVSTGDILSFTELGLVPGFSKEQAEAMRPFVVLKSDRAPGQTERRRRLEQSLTVRGAFRRDDAAGFSAGMKYAAQWGERAEFRWSTRNSYDDGTIRLGTMSAAVYGRRALGKVVLGNFNARFGQGLAQWSGFSLSGYPTVASFRKSGTGLSPTGSYSSDLRGIGSDWRWGRLTFSAAASLGAKNVSGIGNVSWTGRRATFGVTSVWRPSKKETTLSGDWRVGFRNVSLFGEVASKGAGGGFGGVTGAIWTPEYGKKMAVQGRYFSPSFKKDWCGMAAGFENRWLVVTADAAWHNVREVQQYKVIAQVRKEFAVDALSVRPSVRVNARWRQEEGEPWRVDVRGDAAASYGSWLFAARYNALWCNQFAWLWYAELGWTGGVGSAPDGADLYDGRSVSVYARFTLFCVDNWDDRIYVYERDAPGAFNVPAYYGRGYAFSIAAALKRRHRTTHLRASWISYPWNLSEKSGRFELKAQIQL